MLKQLIEASIRRRGIVIALTCVGVVYGLWVIAHAKFDVFPDFAPPRVIVQSEAPGLSPEEVEALVTRPIENAINGTGNLAAIRSQSIQGLSVVTTVFRDGTDIFRARQLVSERLSEIAGKLPEGVRAPAMAPLTSATSEMLMIGLTSRTRSLMDLRTVAEWVVRPALLGVPGVANLTIFGGDVRQLQVQVRPEHLLAYGLGIDDVVTAARGATGVRGAGFVDTPNQRLVLHTEGQSLTPQDVSGTVLAYRGGVSVRLGDVATVVEAPEPKIGDAAIQGEPGVILVVISQYGANTLEATEATERVLATLQPVLTNQGITLHPALFRPANFVTTAVRSLGSSLLVGGILVAVLLFLFLYNARTAFISLTAIPLSLLGAVILLDRLGITLNTLTLGGLAIALGEVVDDAIVDVENIHRRLHGNRTSPEPQPVLRVILDASLEVRGAVVYATGIVALVFLPVFAMSGVQGRLFAPLGLAYVLATVVSLLVALTVTPALAAMLLPHALASATEPGFVTRVKAGYGHLLTHLLVRPRTVLATAFGLCVAAAAMLPFFGGAFLPEFREGHFIVHMSALAGTSIAESLRLGRGVTGALLANPHIRSVAQRVGRAEQSDDTWGTHYSEFNVDLQPLGGEEAEFVQADIRRALMQFPGLSFAIKPFLTERIEETISGVTAEVVIKLFGDDLDALDDTARRVVGVVTTVPGAADVQIESPPGAPQIAVRLRPDRLRQFGLQPVAVLAAVQTAYQGVSVGQLYEANRVFDVVVILDEQARSDPEHVGALLVRSPMGGQIPLAQVADVSHTTGRYAVAHEGAQRRQTVTCNVRGRDLASFVAEAEQRVRAEVVCPAGVYPVFTGAAEAQTQARREIGLYSAIASAGIVLLLSLVFRNVRNVLLVLANWPFSLVGGVLAVFLMGGWLSLGSLIGFVTLFGITARNSILMLSHFEHLVIEEGMPWGPATALRGASERLVPILLTALNTMLGLLPLAVGSGAPGREIEGPMAMVILGGLATSTALNLLVLPTLAVRYGRFE